MRPGARRCDVNKNGMGVRLISCIREVSVEPVKRDPFHRALMYGDPSDRIWMVYDYRTIRTEHFAWRTMAAAFEPRR